MPDPAVRDVVKHQRRFASKRLNEAQHPCVQTKWQPASGVLVFVDEG